MNLSDVKKVDVPRKYRLRVGRGIGSGRGKTAARGFKGQNSRAGSHAKVGFIGGQMPLFRRLPKRGFSNALFKVVYEVVNLSDLAVFAAGSTVGPDDLKAKGLIPRRAERIKVLGHGTVDHALTVQAHAFSKAAKDGIEKKGGTAQEIE